MSAWRDLTKRDKSLAGCILLTAIVFLFNLGTTIGLVARDGASSNLNNLFSVDCDESETISMGIHLAVNVLSSALLASSNFCSQLLMAPTRAEVSACHARGDWHDIGSQSIRNLLKSRIAVSRRVVLGFFFMSSIPLHFLWNSAFFTAVPVDYHLIAAVTSDYAFDTIPWNYTTVDNQGCPYNPDLQTRLLSGGLHRLEKLECMEHYLNFSNRRHGDVVVVSANSTMQDRTTVVHNTTNPTSSLINMRLNVNSAQGWAWRTQWLCSGYRRYYGPPDSRRTTFSRHWCDLDYLQTDGPGKYSDWTLKVGNVADPTNFPSYVKEAIFEVDHCLVGDTEPAGSGCAVRYSSVLLAVVTIANGVKLICVCFVGWIMMRRRRQRQMLVAAAAGGGGRWEEEPLVTIGDAISSFLAYPDPDITGNSNLQFLESRDCSSKPLSVEKLGRPEEEEARRERLRFPVRSFRAAGKSQWILVISLNLILMALVSFGIVIGLQNITSYKLPADLKSLWKLGMGEEHDFNPVIQSSWRAAGNNAFWATVFFAAFPQLIMVWCWYSINALFTKIFVSRYWARFIFTGKRQKLRFSEPVAPEEQKSTYFLSLPYRYSVPLLMASTTAHWLMSQSIFVTQTLGYAYDAGQGSGSGFGRYPEFDASTAMYSPFPEVLTILVSGLCIPAVLFVAWRYIPDRRSSPPSSSNDGIIRMPLVSTCSLAISAACQRHSGLDRSRISEVLWSQNEMGNWGLTSLGIDESDGEQKIDAGQGRGWLEKLSDKTSVSVLSERTEERSPSI